MMRKAFHIALSQALLLVVLVAMMGIPMKKMECLISGDTQVALFDLNTCCSYEAPTEPSICGDCCMFSAELFKVNDPAVEHSFVGQHIAAKLPFSTFDASAWQQPVIVVRTHAFTDLPPPLTGAVRCVQHQSFLI